MINTYATQTSKARPWMEHAWLQSTNVGGEAGDLQALSDTSSSKQRRATNAFAPRANAMVPPDMLATAASNEDFSGLSAWSIAG